MISALVNGRFLGGVAAAQSVAGNRLGLAFVWLESYKREDERGPDQDFG